MLVSEILAIKGKVLYTIGPNRSLGEAVAVMNDQDVGSLVIFDHGVMTGILTFREVLRGIHSGGAQWADLPIAQVMKRDPLTASANMEMDELRRLMVDQHQRYLPVMDGTTLLGVVSFHDVAKAVLEEQSFENRMLKNYIRNWPGDEQEA
ncbi:MAG: CBS domain-containing protein [Rhodocyclaceae bacterium]|nr:CBS domain-containing protein [Rhodocyclaceae bacterium]